MKAGRLIQQRYLPRRLNFSVGLAQMISSAALIMRALGYHFGALQSESRLASNTRAIACDFASLCCNGNSLRQTS
jgi:hypothetical protein